MASEVPFGEIQPVALVTGAASGIGAALAVRLARRASGGLILIDRDEERLRGLADSLQDPPGKVSTFVFDVADPAAWAQSFGLSKEIYGRLDYAAVCAGVAPSASIPDLSFEGWRAVMSANLDGAFLTLKTCMALMRLSPGAGGAITLVSSASAQKAEPGIAAYSASKAGLEQLARVAAREGAPDHIRVNIVAPGGVETPLWLAQPFFQDMIAQYGSEQAAYAVLAEGATPFGRFAQADEIAAILEHTLLQTSPMTGARIVVDGGYSL